MRERGSERGERASRERRCSLQNKKSSGKKCVRIKNWTRETPLGKRFLFVRFVDRRQREREREKDTQRETHPHSFFASDFIAKGSEKSEGTRYILEEFFWLQFCLSFVLVLKKVSTSRYVNM